MAVNELSSYCLELLNDGLVLGATLGTLLLLRPVLLRVFTPQQRMVVWLVGWLEGCGWVVHRGRQAILPLSFQDLLFHRRGRLLSRLPAVLPPEYTGPGDYNVLLPGDVLIRVPLRAWFLLALLALWAVGMGALLALFLIRGRRLRRAVRAGRLLERYDPLLKDIPLLQKGWVEVRVCPGLPASFVRHDPLQIFQGVMAQVCVQEELPPERLRLVLLHEARHIGLWHCFWKWSATISLLVYWWNPVVWLAFRYLSRDMELACDASVLRRLPPEERKEYAKMLVELGSGRQLWGVPLAFGECDGAARVRAVVGWKPQPWWVRLPAWGAAALLSAFFVGSHFCLPPPQDLPLAWERETGSADGFAQVLGQEMGEELWGGQEFHTPPPVPVDQVWPAPGRVSRLVPLSALWVRSAEGQWYRVEYAWWGYSTNWLGVLNVGETSAPDLEGQSPVYLRKEAG